MAGALPGLAAQSANVVQPSHAEANVEPPWKGILREGAMGLFIEYFTERPYTGYDEEAARKAGGRSLTFSNRYYDPQHAHQLYNRYLDEKLYIEEVGFDGLMLNEHHNTVSCMGSIIDLEAAILARQTHRVKIVLLGNVLPIWDNPVRLAEELAEVDVISGGRLVSGFVRGIPTEQYATNTNPSYNRERFQEAHDLVMKTWTTSGPFAWEGKHFQFRVVNPWAVPLQKPHPPIWIPGGLSPETLIWCAQHHYPYVALATQLPATLELWKMYGEAAEELGYQPDTQNFGYLLRANAQETEEKAQEVGLGFLHAGAVGGFSDTPLPPGLASPPGYNSRAARDRALQRRLRSRSPFGGNTYEEVQAMYNIVVGAPATVIKKLRHVLETLRPGNLTIWGNDGTITHEDTMTSVRLMGQEVVPALRAIGKELGLNSPYDKAP